MRRIRSAARRPLSKHAPRPRVKLEEGTTHRLGGSRHTRESCETKLVVGRQGSARGPVLERVPTDAARMERAGAPTAAAATSTGTGYPRTAATAAKQRCASSAVIRLPMASFAPFTGYFSTPSARKCPSRIRAASTSSGGTLQQGTGGASRLPALAWRADRRPAQSSRGCENEGTCQAVGRSNESRSGCACPRS